MSAGASASLYSSSLVRPGAKRTRGSIPKYDRGCELGESLSTQYFSSIQRLLAILAVSAFLSGNSRGESTPLTDLTPTGPARSILESLNVR
jgi:hypothetical protein